MNLLRAAFTVSGLTLLSRVTGLARESIKAVLFGAGAQMDAFEAAFRLPNLLRRLFAEGAFSQAFVPILAEYRERRGDAETRALVDRTTGLLLAVLLGLTALGVVAAPVLVYALASGFAATPGKVELTADLIRICFPYLLFVSLVSLAGGVLNVYRRFAIPAFTPVLLNVALIGSALFLAPYVDPPVVALAWGVFIGGAAQLALQIVPLARLGMLPRPRLDWRDPGVRRVISQMAPAVLGVSAVQVGILLNTQWAALLGDGRVSWITYADRLMEFPTALLGVALGTVILPSLASSHSAADPTRYSALIDWGLRLTILLAVPATAALALLAVPLLATLFQYGRFGAADLFAVREALIGYCVGLVGLIAIKVLAPGFYARQDIRTPVRYALIAILVTQACAVASMPFLGHAGLTLATSVGACVNAVLLLLALRRGGIYAPLAGWGSFLLKVAAGVTVMAIALWIASGADSAWIGYSLPQRAARLALTVVAGLVAYFGTLWITGLRWSDFTRRER